MRTLTALIITALVMMMSRVLEISVPGWVIVPAYVALYLLLGRVGPWASQPETSDEPGEPAPPVLPTSGPIGRFGQAGLIIVFYSSQFLMLLNPFQLVQVVRQIMGNMALQRRERRTGSDGRDRLTLVQYRLPFDDEWLLYNGGPDAQSSHSWDVLGQRFALDFVVCDETARRHRGRGTAVDDYFAYGREVLAAADGTVVAVESRIGDAPLVGWGVCDFTARSFVGNHVIIQHAEAEYALYAHLIRGSVTVKPGDQVHAGRCIGRCGHGGHSSEPHLHFHVQDSPDIFHAMGRPVRFRDFSINGERAPEGKMPRAGQRLAHRPANS